MGEIVAVNRSAGLALDDAGQTHPIITFLDCEGEETTDATVACAAVVALNDGTFAALDLSQFKETPVQ